MNMIVSPAAVTVRGLGNMEVPYGRARSTSTTVLRMEQPAHTMQLHIPRGKAWNARDVNA
jgi:hypothetical protein